MEKRYFTITTNPETGKELVSQLKSKVNEGRSVKIRSVEESPSYWVVSIEAKEDKIEPSDIFFIGLYTGLAKSRIQTVADNTNQ